ncbi:MAG: DNA-directed RNA polymerase subunit beta', partial [Candidatus Aureabacteria bacterium]|nr:DNA-directed RNA polymerase subunit beta' [Candidatus Auribacterota bacterium]
RQLAGMRGLMAKPSGDIIEEPILANFKEGLSVLEYFISTHGARKGLADTALKTADSGYLTRRLVDVAQDVIVLEDDCGTLNGILANAIYEGEDEIVSLKEQIFGRFANEDIVDPGNSRRVIVKAGEEINNEKADEIVKVNMSQVNIRSVLTCESKVGTCAKCYGRNLSTQRIVRKGEAVGIIAAQSIGEPGTQLTMRTFHIGGTASQIFKQPVIIAKNNGIIKYTDIKTVKIHDGNYIALNKNGIISIQNNEGRELEKYSIIVGAVIKIPSEGKVKKGDEFVEWDPYSVPIITEFAGRIEFVDIIEGQTMKKELDDSTGLAGTVIIEHREELHPQILIRGLKDDGEVKGYYSIPAGAHIVVKNKQKVMEGTMLAKTPRKISKTRDITGGLPRVAELFEARRPKDAADIAKIDGVVELEGTVKGRRKVIIRDEVT